MSVNQQYMTATHQVPTLLAKCAPWFDQLAWYVQVVSNTDLSSAARRIWLAVHPDKNSSPGAEAACHSFSSLLGSLKSKGAL